MNSVTGRPTKYSKEIAHRLPEMFADGESVAEVCRELGVARSTFYEWVSRHEEFSEAYELGQTFAEAAWCRVGREAAMGERRISASCWIFCMKSRYHWSDNPRPEEEEELTPEEYARRVELAMREMNLADRGGSS